MLIEKTLKAINNYINHVCKSSNESFYKHVLYKTCDSLGIIKYFNKKSQKNIILLKYGSNVRVRTSNNKEEDLVQYLKNCNSNTSVKMVSSVLFREYHNLLKQLQCQYTYINGSDLKEFIKNNEDKIRF